MHNRQRLGVVPTELTLRQASPASLGNQLLGLLAQAHQVNGADLERLTLGQLLEPLEEQLRARTVRSVRSLPLDGFDDPRDNAEGAEVLRALAQGALALLED